MKHKMLDFVKSAERWQRYGENYHDEARIYYSELNKTTLTIATFLLGFIGIFMQIGDIKKETLESKFLIGASFVLSTASIFLGFLVFVMMNKFLNKSGDYYETLSDRLHLWIIKNNQDRGYQYPEEIKRKMEAANKASNCLSNLQITCLGLSFITLAVYFYSYIFL